MFPQVLLGFITNLKTAENRAIVLVILGHPGVSQGCQMTNQFLPRQALPIQQCLLVVFLPVQGENCGVTEAFDGSAGVETAHDGRVTVVFDRNDLTLYSTPLGFVTIQNRL